MPIAAPSANLFGHTSPTTAAHVLADLDGVIDAVLAAGPARVGVESPVLDPAPTPMVLSRPGAVTAAMLTEATGVAVRTFVPNNEASKPEALPSPGVGLRHYAPAAQLILLEGNHDGWEAAVNSMSDARSPQGVLLPSGWRVPKDSLVALWGDWDDPAELAANLFAGLRGLDDRRVATILCPLPAPGGMRDAIRDRLLKAAKPA